jgi:hypothetical protein
MYKFATDIFFSEDELVDRLVADHAPTGKVYQPLDPAIKAWAERLK